MRLAKRRIVGQGRRVGIGAGKGEKRGLPEQRTLPFNSPLCNSCFGVHISCSGIKVKTRCFTPR